MKLAAAGFPVDPAAWVAVIQQGLDIRTAAAKAKNKGASGHRLWFGTDDARA